MECKIQHGQFIQLRIHAWRKTEIAKKILKDILLDKAGVDLISQQIQSWLSQTKMEHRNITRLRLALEDLLEDLCAHYERKARIVILQMELVHEAEHWKLLDKDRLRA